MSQAQQAVAGPVSDRELLRARQRLFLGRVPAPQLLCHAPQSLLVMITTLATAAAQAGAQALNEVAFHPSQCVLFASGLFHVLLRMHCHSTLLASRAPLVRAGAHPQSMRFFFQRYGQVGVPCSLT